MFTGITFWSIISVNINFYYNLQNSFQQWATGCVCWNCFIKQYRIYQKNYIILNDTKMSKKVDFNFNGNNNIFKKHIGIKKKKSIYSYIKIYKITNSGWKIYFSLIPKGSQLGKMYGMAKHHKIYCPLQPVQL